MFKAIGLNEVSKRVGEEGGEEAPEHPSIGERPTLERGQPSWPRKQSVE